MTRAREISNVLGRNIESTTFTATADQTAFSITHAAGRIQVYLNGLLLDPTVDWTSDGSTVTLTEGAIVGDELEVVKFDNLAVADAIPRTGHTGTIDFSDATFTPPAGYVINYTDWKSATATSISTTSEVTISAASHNITSVASGSKFVYHVVLSSETDVTADNRNGFFLPQYKVGSGSWVDPNISINMGGVSHGGGGTANNAVTITFAPTYTVGDVIYFRTNFVKSDAANVQFNQQSLGSQPSGTSNYVSGYIMEIAQ